MNSLYLGYITPATFTYQHYFKNLRSFFHQYQVVCVCKYLYEVFEDAEIGDSVSWIVKKEEAAGHKYNFLLNVCNTPDDLFNEGETKEMATALNPDGTYSLNVGGVDFPKLYASCQSLGEISQIIVGIKPYQTGKGAPKQTKDIVASKPFTSDKPIDGTYKMCLIGKDFHRYRLLRTPSMYLSYGEWLAEPRETAPFFEEKIILRQTADSLIATIDHNNINLNNVYNIGRLEDKYNIKYVLALINSKLLTFIYRSIAQEKGRLFAEVKKIYLEKLPIKDIPKTDQRLFAEKADKMLTLNEALKKVSNKFIKFIRSSYNLETIPAKLSGFYNLEYSEFLKELKKLKVSLPKKEEYGLMELFETEKEKILALNNQVEQTDREIDQMVHDLYGLAPEEVEIVED